MVGSTLKLGERSGVLCVAVASLFVVAVMVMAGSASAASVTDPNDPRTWQGAGVGTFASLIYGSDTLANRQQIIDEGLLDDGAFNTSGVGYGSYYGNNLGCSGYSTLGGTYGYSCGSESLAQYTSRANDLDWEWIQDTGYGGSSWAEGNVWDLVGQANQAAVFPIVDHGPLPGEAIEYTVYLSNNPYATSIGADGSTQWVLASLDKVYLEGWNTAEIADGFTTVWRLPDAQTFRYVNVFSGGPGALRTDGDDELDAVAGLTYAGDPVKQPVPEPGTLLLLGSGLAGIGYVRRRIKG